MKIKVLTADINGNIVISKEELQKILDAVYDEGYKNGRDSQTYYTYLNYTPHQNWWLKDYTITTADNSSYNLDNTTLTTSKTSLNYKIDEDGQTYLYWGE